MDNTEIDWTSDVHVIESHVPCEFIDQLDDMTSLSTSLGRAQLEGYRIEKIRAGMEDETSFLYEFQVFAWVKQELVSQNASL
eukprot:12621374-Heterocapsa_arctica.AAC.1